MPKPRKYKRKKSGELSEPVEKINSRITVFRIKIPHGPSPPMLKKPLPRFLSERSR
jgi:hypothetical protein